MEVYIDKANLESFISFGSHKMFTDCSRMLKNKFKLKFNFNKEEIKGHADILKWITTMTDGVKEGVLFSDELFPSRPLKSNMHIGFNQNQLSAVYMLDDEKVDLVKNKGCFLIASVGEEINVLSHLIIKDSDYSFDKKIRLSDMGNWSVFNDHISPCSDIIIIDKYILCDETIYEHNIYSLINTLISPIGESKINIAIVTSGSHYTPQTKTTFTPNWIAIKTKIKSNVKNKTKIDPNVTFVLSPNDIAEHDRTIFTNYRRIYSGDTFNYFDCEGRIISKGKEVHLCSMADIDNYNLGMELISDVQKLVISIKGRNPDLIIGDEKSNYLKFD